MKTMKNTWVTEGTVPGVNRFEIRVGNFFSAPYGAEMVSTQHNNQISVVIEMARKKAQAARLDKADALAGWSYRRSYTERLHDYTVVERVDHLLEEQLEDCWPAQVIKQYRWSTARRESGVLFGELGLRRTIQITPFQAI